MKTMGEHQLVLALFILCGSIDQLLWLNYHMLIDMRQLKTDDDFLKEIALLSNNDAESIMKRAWLFDQWALISSDDDRVTRQTIAENLFKQAEKMGAGKQRVLNGLGTVALHRNDFKESLKLYTTAHEIEHNFNTYNALGNVLRQLGNYKSAKRHYQQAKSLATNQMQLEAVQHNIDQLEKIFETMPTHFN